MLVYSNALSDLWLNTGSLSRNLIYEVFFLFLFFFFAFWPTRLCRDNSRHFLVQWKCNLVDYPLATGYNDNSYHCWKIPFNVQVQDVCLWSWACAEADFLSQTYLQQGEITNIRETSRLHCSHGTSRWHIAVEQCSHFFFFLACPLNLSQTL